MTLCVSLFLGFEVAAASLLGESSKKPLQAEQAFILNKDQTNDGVDLIWIIADDYYLYQDKINVRFNGSDITPYVTLPQGVEKLDPLFGNTLVFYTQLVLQVNWLEAGINVVQDQDKLVVGYQGCWEGGICYPPQTQEIALQGVVVGQSDGGNTQTPPNNHAQTASQSAIDPDENTPSFDNPSTNANWYKYQFFGASVGALVATFFLAGLGLALTPCVLPMVPILSNIIVGMKPKPTPTKSFLLSLTYVVSMAVTYALVGVLAGLTGANFQAALQHPYIIVAMVGLFVLFAAAMFDWVTVQVPTVIQQFLSELSQRQASGQYVGVSAMGIISALVVGPCVAAPLAGALLYISQTGDPVLGGSALLALGLGMGAPLLLVGTSAVKWLPKSGAWMNRVKHGFGFVMLFMAVWMLDRISAEATVPLVMILTLVMAGTVWNAHRWQPPIVSVVGNAVVFVLAVLLTLYGLALGTSTLAGKPSLFKPLGFISGVVSGTSANQAQVLNNIEKIKADEIDAKLAFAAQRKKPVMMDFYADWCVLCKELDAWVIPEAAVQKELARFVYFKVDVTEANDLNQHILAKYGIVGPPGLVFFDSNGQALPNKTMVGVPTPQALENRLMSIN